MSNKVFARILILAYCFPFVFFSMLQDFNNGTMLGYLLMVIATPLLAVAGKRHAGTWLPVIGNLLSAFVSYFFISQMAGDVVWDAYYKPLSPVQLFLFVSVLSIIPQWVAVKWAGRTAVSN